MKFYMLKSQSRTAYVQAQNVADARVLFWLKFGTEATTWRQVPILMGSVRETVAA